MIFGENELLKHTSTFLASSTWCFVALAGFAQKQQWGRQEHWRQLFNTVAWVHCSGPWCHLAAPITAAGAGELFVARPSVLSS